MGFKISSVDTIQLNSLLDIRKFVQAEEESIVYEPIIDYLNNNSIFMDDEFLGRGKKWISFNDEGFSDYCNKFNLPGLFIKNFDKNGLASEALNDQFKKKSNLEIAKRNSFVIDKRNNICLGLVSNSYLVYSNNRFMNDLNELFPNICNYELQECFSYNTKLYIRMVSSEIDAGRVRGKGGDDVDICKIGLQVSNSMIGGSAVRTELFIYRLLCANGLIMQTSKNNGRVYHSGKDETFPERLKKQFFPINSEIYKLPKLIETLLDIEYNPKSLVDLKAQDIIYGIIPLPKEINEKRKRMKSDDKYQFDLQTISEYPSKYGLELSSRVFNSNWRNNQSMYDYVNIFTEYARRPGHNIEGRIEMERQAGEFVSWIIRNKKRLKETNNKYAIHN